MYKHDSILKPSKAVWRWKVWDKFKKSEVSWSWEGWARRLHRKCHLFGEFVRAWLGMKGSPAIAKEILFSPSPNTPYFPHFPFSVSHCWWHLERCWEWHLERCWGSRSPGSIDAQDGSAGNRLSVLTLFEKWKKDFESEKVTDQDHAVC